MREKADHGGDQSACADMPGNVKPLNRLPCGQTVNIGVPAVVLLGADECGLELSMATVANLRMSSILVVFVDPRLDGVANGRFTT